MVVRAACCDGKSEGVRSQARHVCVMLTVTLLQSSSPSASPSVACTPAQETLLLKLGIVAGEAGVGKSFFLQAALLMLQLRRGPRCAAVVAQSNMAAN